MTKLYLLSGSLDDDTRHALLAAANDQAEAGWAPVRTGSRDTVIAGPRHFIKLLAPTPLTRLSGLAPARLLVALIGRGVRLARREQSMNVRGINTAPIQARGLVGNREFLLTRRAEGQTLHALLPSLSHADRKNLIQALASAIAMLHERGIYHGDLNCYNLIVTPDAAHSFCFLDNGSTRVRHGEICDDHAQRNLSQLNFWLLPGKLNRTDRLRFLGAYLAHRGRTASLPQWWKNLDGRFSERMQKRARSS